MTAPKAVRERRAARGQESEDATADDVSPSEFASYLRALALGNLMDDAKNGVEPTPREWLAKLNARRTRIRGIRIHEKDGQKKVDAMGQKIYLPNIIFRLVRNFTPPGKPYNPFEATFRIPQSVTKTDIRSYLFSVYGVETTYIRTDNYISPIFRAGDGSWTRKKPHKTYKRAVVGLVKPFHYPLAIEDLPRAHREEREKWIEDSFNVKGARVMRKQIYLRMTKRGSKKWKWRSMATVGRSQILKAVAEARTKREYALTATAQLMNANRADNLPTDVIDAQQMRRLAEQEREREDSNYRRSSLQ